MREGRGGAYLRGVISPEERRERTKERKRQTHKHKTRRSKAVVPMFRASAGFILKGGHEA